MDTYFEWRFMVEYTTFLVFSVFFLLGCLVWGITLMLKKIQEMLYWRRPYRLFWSKLRGSYYPVDHIENNRVYPWLMKWNSSILRYEPVCNWEEASRWQKLIAHKTKRPISLG